MLYKHTQIGYFIILALLIGVWVTILFNSVLFLVFLAIVGLIFSTLTISVDVEYVRLSFGPGVIHFRFPIVDIETCEVAKFPCRSWGIDGWPGRGWVINVSGFHTVELKMRNDGEYAIGTDQPEALEKAIRHAMDLVRHRALKVE